MPTQEPEYPSLVVPESVERQAVTIWSGGVALDGDVYRPRNLGEDRQAPAVVLSHGLGGSKRTAERYAARFAAAGMVALSFTHAGWHGSDSRLMQVGGAPDLDGNNEAIARVRAIRELVDPLEWIQSYRAAVDYIEGEPNVDRQRIGAWGTSFGGGIAMFNAANDARIKALAVQVAFLAGLPEPVLPHARQRAIDMARGKISSLPQGIDAFPSAPGTPHLARSLQYNVLNEVGKLHVPTLMLDAGSEDMFDIRENGGRAHTLLKERSVPVRYEVIDDIDHYGIYFAGYERSSATALAWFERYL